MVNSSIEGTLHCKNQLDGRPCFHIQLNPKITKGKKTERLEEGEEGSLFVDDMNFHSSVNVEEFKEYRRLSLTGPEG